MEDKITVIFTKQEMNNLLGFLDRVEYKGLGEAQIISILVSRIARAEKEQQGAISEE